MMSIQTPKSSRRKSLRLFLSKLQHASFTYIQFTSRKINFVVAKLSLALVENICIFFGMTHSENNKPKESNTIRIRHIVCLKFIEQTTPEQINEIEDRFPQLKDSIPGIASIEWGTNNSPEVLNKGFSHCFLVTFHNEEARTNYLPHPSHQAFVDLLKPLLEDVFVIDYNL